MLRRTAAVLVVCVGAALVACSDDSGGRGDVDDDGAGTDEGGDSAGDDSAGDDGGDGDGNGVAGLTANEILAEARAAVGAAGSAHVAASFEDEGEAVEFEITYDGGGGASGTITNSGTDLELLSIEGDFFIRGTADAWEDMTGDPAAGELFTDKYVAVPADDPAFADLAELLDFESFTGGILVTDSEASIGDETEVNGQAAVGVGLADGATVYIATTGETLPLQLAPPRGERGSVDFEWGVDAEIIAPDEADVVDLSEIE